MLVLYAISAGMSAKTYVKAGMGSGPVGSVMAGASIGFGGQGSDQN